jgi:hypothetical protein
MEGLQPQAPFTINCLKWIHRFYGEVSNLKDSDVSTTIGDEQGRKVIS